MERWNEQDYQIVFVANTNEHTAGHLPKSSRSPKHTHHHPHPPITAHYPGAKFSSRNHLAPHFDALGARNCLSYVSNEMKRFVLPVNPLTTTPPAPPSTSPLGLVTTHPPGTHSNGITVIMPWLLPLTHTHTHTETHSYTRTHKESPVGNIRLFTRSSGNEQCGGEMKRSENEVSKLAGNYLEIWLKYSAF